MSLRSSHLSQRRLLGKRLFTLLDDGLLVEEWSFFGHRRYKVPFEVIPDDEFVAAVSSRLLFWLAVLSGAAALALALALGGGLVAAAAAVLALLLGLAFLLSRRSYVGYATSEGQLIFFADERHAGRLGPFLERLQQAKREYLESPETRSQNSTQVADDLERLTWLREQGYLTDDEFECLKQRLIAEERGAPGGTVH